MPLPKRLVEPVHVARNTLPQCDFPLPSELEAVTNGTLANTVRQLSSLSRHAEDLFGELARDTHQLYDRSNSLQARIDRLAIKVTQLDSTYEEVSLQDIHNRKAFKSSAGFEQQIFSRNTMPTAMQETYQACDKPPPLSLLNKFRDDDKDSLKFYTDPNYFFELWREEVLKDTERAKQGKKPHKPRNAQSTDGSRQKKRVRQPQKTIERQRQIAVGHGEYLIPTEPRAQQPPPQQQQQQPPPSAVHSTQAAMQAAQQQQMHMNQMHYRNPLQMQQEEMQHMMERPNRPNSIEIRRSYQQEVPDGVHSPMFMPYDDQNQYQPGMYGGHAAHNEQHYQPGTPTRKIRPTQPPPAPPSNQSTPSANTPTRGRSMSAGRDNLPPPPPPPEALMSPPNGIPAHLIRQTSGSRSNSPHSHQGTPEPDQDLPPPPPVPKQASPPKQATPVQAPPPPPPPPMPLLSNGPVSPPPPITNGDLAKILNSAPPKLTPPKERAIQKAPPMVDPRNDLLKAIRDGIKLRKVEKIEQKEVERGNGLHDVASILARRVAVEFSDSDSASESDCDSEGWGENETSA